MSIALLNTDQIEELTALALSRIGPGRVDEKKLGIKNIDAVALANIKLAWWPGLQNNTFLNTVGSPIVSCAILRSENQTKKTTAVAKEDGDGLLSLRTTRDPIVKYDSGADQHDSYYPTGDVELMEAANDYVYFLFEVPYRNLWCEVKTAGSYGSRTWQKYTSSGWTALTLGSDGTSGFTVDGNIDFGSGVYSGLERVTINGITGYGIRVKAASVTTQGVLDVCYPNFIYELTKCCLFGEGDYYTFDGASTYTPVTPAYEYPGHGLIVFDSDPLTADVSIHADYSYKDPQPKDYALTFSESGGQWKCSVDGGSAIDITANGTYINKQVIPGIGFVFSSGITTSDEATISVSPGLKFLWFAQDDGGSADTYSNGDINLVDELAVDATHPFWMKREPFTTEDPDDSNFYIEPYFYEV